MTTSNICNYVTCLGFSEWFLKLSDYGIIDKRNGFDCSGQVFCVVKREGKCEAND